jgi:hypothetical protein
VVLPVCLDHTGRVCDLRSHNRRFESLLSLEGRGELITSGNPAGAGLGILETGTRLAGRTYVEMFSVVRFGGSFPVRAGRQRAA